ncbi:hypothetical protein Ctob_005529 [Chrysochromulina tobinii]|uniref:Uncharacterized protein n=1 Tax=Chrysochromulina tobinii TaxID=1460289 RepID=A0A0M0JEE4_9EUKA|nr:hypothetical protein Ctob_005529 [Chrysochromulina tobinii]|eukprot:KOO24830.1 hypothetical protein Ctob_005529 [Chrysochromulina sp. CCMP291]
MYQGLLRCERNGGAVFFTSEHRLSLQLKGHELRLSEKGSGANADSFERIRAKLDQLHSLPYHDAQEAEYTLWLSSASQMINDEQRQALDSVDKLDLTSEPQQLDMLFTLCKYNMAAVNFWLNSCVLPRETMQFPNRLWPTRST